MIMIDFFFSQNFDLNPIYITDYIILIESRTLKQTYEFFI